MAIILLLFAVLFGWLHVTCAVLTPVLLYDFSDSTKCASGIFPEKTGKGPNMVLSGGGICKTKTLDGRTVNGVTIQGSCASPNDLSAFLTRDYNFTNGMSVEYWISLNDDVTQEALSNMIIKGLMEASRHTQFNGSSYNAQVGTPISFDANDVQYSAVVIGSGNFGDGGDFDFFGSFPGQFNTQGVATEFSTYGYCQATSHTYLGGLFTGSFSNYYPQQTISNRLSPDIIKLVFTEGATGSYAYISTVDGMVDWIFESLGSNANVSRMGFIKNSFLRLGCAYATGSTEYDDAITFHKLAVYDKKLTQGEVVKAMANTTNVPEPPVIAWQILPPGESPWNTYGIRGSDQCPRFFRSHRKRRVIDLDDYAKGVPVYNNMQEYVTNDLFNRSIVLNATLASGTDWVAWWKTPGDCADPYYPLNIQDAQVVRLNKTGLDRFERKSCDSESVFVSGTYESTRLCLVEVLRDESQQLSFVTEFSGIGPGQPQTATTIPRWQLIVGQNMTNGMATYPSLKDIARLRSGTFLPWVYPVSFAAVFSFNDTAEVYDPSRSYVGTIAELYSLATSSILPVSYSGIRVWSPGGYSSDCVSWTSSNASLTTVSLDPVLMSTTEVACDTLAYPLYLVELIEFTNGTLNWIQ